MKYWSFLFAGLLAAANHVVLGQEADSYIAALTVTPNAFVAGSRVDIRTDMKEFSSFFYRGVFWQASLDGVNFQWIGDAQQVGGDSSLTYVFRFENIPSSTFFLRAGVVTESFVVSGRTTTEYTSAVQINPLTQGAPGAIGFQVNAGSVGEAIGEVTVNVFRTGGISGPVGVTYNLVGGTAQAGQDFVAASGTVSFADGETAKSFTIQVTEDALVEGDETFSIVLSQPTGGATLGEISSLTVTIQDNDVGAPAQPRLGLPEFQPGGAVEFTFTGTSGQAYLIERSADLRTWTRLTNVTPAGDPVRITDPNPNSAQMFYRARSD